jgi:hypothetical protein
LLITAGFYLLMGAVTLSILVPMALGEEKELPQ